MDGSPGQPPSKPATQNGDLRHLPAALANLVEQRRWVVWRWEWVADGERWTKVPYQPARPERKASSNRPATWGDHASAVEAVEAGQADGIGFMLHESTIAAFDIDNGRDPETGEVASWAWRLVDAAASYTEITVSGTGLRVIGAAQGNPVHRNQAVAGAAGRIETYRRATRYIVVTGLELSESSGELVNIDPLIDDTVARLDAEAAGGKRREKGPAGADRSDRNAGAKERDPFGFSTSLPPDLDRLIRYGVSEAEDRSKEFHHAVGWLKQLGHTPDEIEALLSAHPDGIAAKYAGRLGREIDRSFGKTEGPPSGAFQQGPGPTQNDERPAIIATPYTWQDPAMIPRRDWLYGRHLIRKFVSATVAPGGVGKSSLAIAEALAMVSGRDLLEQNPFGPQLRVWLWNLEDPREEIARRIQATAKHYELTPDDLGERLFVDSGREQALVIAETTKTGAMIVRPVVESIISQVQERGIDVVIVDPFVSCHQINENDNNAVDMVTKEWGKVAERSNCAIELVHHTRKMLGVESEVTTESARGGKALTDACRSVRVVNRMSKEEGERAGIENPRLHFRTFSDKLNLAPPPDRSDWFRLERVDLGNGPIDFVGTGLGGDNIGVVVPWSWPDPLDTVSVADLRAAQAAVEKGRWRENAQARDWVGIPIAAAMKLDLSKPADKAKVKAALRIWMTNGMFVVVEGLDEKRNKRSFVEVGEKANDDCHTFKR